MEYLLDTVTIVRYFSNSKNIGKQALQILDNNENQFYIPVMALIEIMYLAEKKRITISLQEVITKVEQRRNCHFLNITPPVVTVANNIDFPELHDRLILASAKFLNIPIISSDGAFPSVDGITTIWN